MHRENTEGTFEEQAVELSEAWDAVVDSILTSYLFAPFRWLASIAEQVFERKGNR